MCDAGLVADLENSCQGFKAEVVALNCLNAVAAGEPSVPVHYEGDVFRDRALPEGSDQKLADLVDRPFGGRGGEYPFPDGGDVLAGAHSG